MANWNGMNEANTIGNLSGTVPEQMNAGLGADGDTSVSQCVNIGALGWVTGNNAIGIGYRARADEARAITIGATASST
ncbi:MAG: hypothetical protein GY946_07610, partial [bacterium]|nr:hypothetical protein [bacterium]